MSLELGGYSSISCVTVASWFQKHVVHLTKFVWLTNYPADIHFNPTENRTHLNKIIEVRATGSKVK